MLNLARSDLAKQELHVESLDKCIGDLQLQMEAQRLALQDAQYGFLESKIEQVRLQEELSMREKVLRNTQIRNMHEMGEMKRPQELRTEEVSVQKLRENRETIQQLTSQLQQMQEQNSMSDSGDFQDVESNYNGRLSHVSSPPAMIPSSRSLLSRDKRLPLDTWNQIWITGKCFGNQFLRFKHPEIVIKEIPHSITLGTAGSISVLIGTGDSGARDEDLTRGTIPMPTFARRPWTTSSTISVELPQNYKVGRQRQRISELQFDKIPNPPSLLVWEIRFKNQVTTCSDFPSDAMLWIKEVEMVVSLDAFKSSRSVSGKNFQTSRCWMRRLLLL